MMLRSKPLASLTRTSLRNLRSSPSSRGISSKTLQYGAPKPHLPQLSHVSKPLAIMIYRPFSTSLKRYQIDNDKKIEEEKFEQQIQKEKLEVHPEIVSGASSTHPVFGEVGKKEEEIDVDMMAEIKSDLRTIKEIFALQEVPREAFLLGLAGLLPYVATSLTTVYLAWDINHADLTGHGFLLSGADAQAVLNYIEPLQIGYGAVIISFLGAIHWGLEWAGFGGHQGFKRYAIGVIAPAVAWPTILMPIEYALISQFLAFTTLYYADAQATVNGWVPHWYSSYRFVLTFIVGASIVFTLIGRGEIVDKMHRLPNPQDRVMALKAKQMEEMEREERFRQEQLLKEEEEEDAEDGEAEEAEADDGE